MCDTIGETEICTRCEATHVPINGKCVLASGAANCKAAAGSEAGDQTCGKCLSTIFMYKGGCYEGSNALGQIICETIGSEAGKCQTCNAANDYFTNPDAANNVDSCISCGDAAGVTIGNSNTKTYKGVDGCAKCNPPGQITESTGAQTAAATCTECATDLYLKTEASGATSCVANNECTGGFFPMTDTADSNKKKCLACNDNSNGVVGCEKCTAPDKGKTKPTCTECTDKYLKTVDGTTMCVAKDACKDDYFPEEDNTNGNKCVSCGDETNGVPNCAKCSPPSSTGQKPACSDCGSGYKLEGGACVSAGGVNLSTGAIAGISVAAVVVVGGLVGFLCWWFICRGKA